MKAIEVTGVSKRYSLEKSASRRFLDLIRPSRHQKPTDFWALRDLNFSVERGESFGIVGTNGSGKSTLLQILAGVMQPTLGTASAVGRTSAILELGSGFNPEFTGRQNVFLNAAILGLSEEQIRERYPQIAEFAEIGGFLDQPVRTYSSGMVMRLAFSVAVHIDPEILIVDEALAVGDIYFQQRCLRHLHRMRERNVTLVFVSHSPTELRALCTRCLWLDRGQAREVGETDTVIGHYLAHSAGLTSHRNIERKTAALASPEPAPKRAPAKDVPLGTVTPLLRVRHRFGSQSAEVVGADIVGPSGAAVVQVRAGDPITVRVAVRAIGRVERPIVGFLMRNERGETIYGTNTAREQSPLPPLNPGAHAQVSFRWIAPALATQRYAITVGISDGDLTTYETCDYAEDALSLDFRGSDEPVGDYLGVPWQARWTTGVNGGERATYTVSRAGEANEHAH